MTAVAFKEVFQNFANVASPYLKIRDDEHYHAALALVESLLEEAVDAQDDPLNSVIDLLSRAIESYENRNVELVAFEQSSASQPSDLVMLRVLMDQHNLGTGDLPEIGSKSMVSRVLSGERSLNKKHIRALADRFQISPSLFF